MLGWHRAPTTVPVIEICANVTESGRDTVASIDIAGLVLQCSAFPGWRFPSSGAAGCVPERAIGKDKAEPMEIPGPEGVEKRHDILWSKSGIYDLPG